MYIDVGCKAGEVAELRSECMTLKLRVSNQDALTWLNQLLSACEPGASKRTWVCILLVIKQASELLLAVLW